MQPGPEESSPHQRRVSALSGRLTGPLRRRDPVVLAVLAIALVALGLRLAWIGHRAAHWDEARVAYWILRYQETGALAYRPIIHGPFVHHVTQPLFALFGPSDLVSRVPVAIVGGLFPLSALLFREHLRDHETVILAFILGTNSILLYYSRFLRSDVLVAAFMLTALGFLVRTYDTRNGRYLYPAALFLGFGIASKENALIYILTWLGAAGLLLGAALLRPRPSTSRRTLVRGTMSAAVGRLRTRDRGLKLFVGHAVGAGVLLFVVWLFMFAPRGAAPTYHPWPATETRLGSLSLGDALARPWKLPELVWNTGTYWLERYPTWSDKAIDSSGDTSMLDRYEEFAPQYFEVLQQYAFPTLLFGAFGTARALFGGLCAVFAPLRERFDVDRPRNLVLFAGYAGFASVIGYPAGLDIFGPWNAAHPVVILAIPAAAGLGIVYRWGRDSVRRHDDLQAMVAGLVLLVVVGHVFATAAGAAYVTDSDADSNGLIQYGQPADDFREEVERLDRVAAANEGVDVLVYGSYFTGDDSSVRSPSCMSWFDGLPMSWYLHAADASVTCVESSDGLEQLDDDLPPVVLTQVDDISTLQDRVSGYEYSIFRIRTFGSETALLFDERAIERG
jgi:uncharacterized protein (TIGR03663 family)